MVYFTFFITITLIVYGIILIRIEKKERVKKRLSAFLSVDKSKHVQETHLNLSAVNKVFKPMLQDFRRSFKKRMPGEKEAKIEKRLQMAGNPFGMTPVDFRLFQIALFITFPTILGGLGSIVNAGNGEIVFLVLLGLLLGAFTPHLYIKQKMKARNFYALRELPDVLDLLTVSLEAGLGFDSAVSKVVSKKEGVLAGEFHRALEEIRLGKTRREALGGIRDRLDVDEVRSFISSILQAEKLGIGMVQVMRVQSSEVRDRRKQRAEEAAMKAPIKMLFPLVLFIFPSLFIVLLGPAIIQFLQTFQNK